MKAFYNYLKYVLVHKYWVFVYGRQLKVPLWNLIWHDWTKFLPDEFIPRVRNFYGFEESNGQYVQNDDFFYSWNLHQKRNKHHSEFWMVLLNDGSYRALEMPEVHVREMVADWMGASKMHKGNAWNYYLEHKNVTELHPKTRELFEVLLQFYA